MKPTNIKSFIYIDVERRKSFFENFYYTTEAYDYLRPY